MSNVHDAMKRHQAEEAKKAAEKAAAAAASAPAQSAALTPATSDAAAPSSQGSAVLTAMTTPQVRREPAANAQPVLQATSDGYSPALAAFHDRGGEIAEQMRAIRTNLLAKHADGRFSIVMTSAEAGEGKTVTTLNLSVILAERKDYTSVVLDCDLRRGHIGSMLAGRSKPGIAEFLRSEAPLADIIQPTVFPNLSYIAAGHASRAEVSELLAKPAAEDLIKEMRRRFDSVLVDCPPAISFSEAAILGRATGEALIVVRMNKTNRESVDRAIRLLNAANVKVAGIILTHQQYPIPKYLYRYS